MSDLGDRLKALYRRYTKPTRYDHEKPPTRVYPAWLHGDIDDGTTKRESEYEPMDEIEFVRELNRGRRKKR